MNIPAAQPEPAADNPILDASLVAEARATLRDKFPRIVGFFLEDSETYIKQIEEGFAAGNAEIVMPPAHTLKSSARQMGASRLSEVARLIETQAKEAIKGDKDISGLKLQVESLRPIFAATQAAFGGTP